VRGLGETVEKQMVGNKRTTTYRETVKGLSGSAVSVEGFAKVIVTVKISLFLR